MTAPWGSTIPKSYLVTGFYGTGSASVRVDRRKLRYGSTQFWGRRNKIARSALVGGSEIKCGRNAGTTRGRGGMSTMVESHYLLRGVGKHLNVKRFALLVGRLELPCRSSEVETKRHDVGLFAFAQSLLGVVQSSALTTNL